MQHEGHQAEHGRQHEQRAKHGRHQIPVRQPAAEQIASDQADAEDQQDRRHGGLVEADELSQQRRNVGEYGKDAGIAQHGGEQAEQHRAARHRGQVGTPVTRFGWGFVARHEKAHHDQRDNTNAGHRPERGAPTESLAQPCAEGHAHDGSHRQPGEQEGDGRRTLVRRHQAGGHHGADAKEAAMGECGQHAGGHQQAIAWCQRAGGVAQRKDHHQAQQHGLARPARGHRREQRRPRDDTQRIAGDQPAGRLNRNAKLCANFQQQSHDDELGDPDAEGTRGERVKSKWHELMSCEFKYDWQMNCEFKSTHAVDCPAAQHL